MDSPTVITVQFISSIANQRFVIEDNQIENALRCCFSITPSSSTQIWMLWMTHRVRASTASEGHSTPLPWQWRPPSEELCFSWSPWRDFYFFKRWGGGGPAWGWKQQHVRPHQQQVEGVGGAGSGACSALSNHPKEDTQTRQVKPEVIFLMRA